MRKLNKTLAGLMAAVMVLLGVSVTPAVADAAETPKEVYYATAAEFEIAKYWDETNPVAPVKDGYVFGGWYTAENGTPIKQVDLETNGASAYPGAVAKFVPSYVLSVKMQINVDTETSNGATLPYTREDGTAYTNMRLLSAVDSVKYQNVGFDIVLDKTGAKLDLNYTKVYAELAAKDNNKLSAITPTGIFGSPATHFIAAELSNILAGNLEKIIYVTPYWTTIDGTKVEGASKFIRVMDGYAENKYISIPVNILTNVNAAAGMVEMKYDSDKLQYIEWQKGVLYTEMAANTADAESANNVAYTGTKVEKTIKFVGNGDTVDNKYMTAEDIYANVWFKVKDNAAITTNSLEFTMDTKSFCSWDEELLSTVKAWDVLY